MTGRDRSRVVQLASVATRTGSSTTSGDASTGVRSAVADQLHALAAIDADGVDVIVVKIVLPPPAGRTS